MCALGIRVVEDGTYYTKTCANTDEYADSRAGSSEYSNEHTPKWRKRIMELTYTAAKEDNLARHIYANIRAIQTIYNLTPEELVRIMEEVEKGLGISREYKR